MISKKEIEHLAELSRLKINQDEISRLESDFLSILEYVGQVNSIKSGAVESDFNVNINVMRNDTVEPFAVGGSRESLLNAAPCRKGDYFSVRQILSKDQETNA